MKDDVPEKESLRLSALREYQILDSATEDTYDEITQLAAYICGADGYHFLCGQLPPMVQVAAWIERTGNRS
jgi:hypothetical protein